MENKLQKVILVTDDGERKEYEGVGVVVVAVTSGEKETKTQGGVVGSFNLSGVAAVIRDLEMIFKEQWQQAMLAVCLEGLLDVKPEAVGMDPDAGEAACENGGGRGCTSSLIDRLRGAFGKWKR
ncbi:MAG: hypothetical protein J6M10_10410 [Clostridia bacterium]|nr:hypothetical protein [Clostridia bacterium]